MTEDETGSSIGSADIDGDDRVRVLERQLALVDRVIGLEAQLVEFARLNEPSPVTGPGSASNEAALRAELDAVLHSRSFRLGSALLRPVRIVARIVNRGRAR